jgi:hypothetical protein
LAGAAFALRRGGPRVRDATMRLVGRTEGAMLLAQATWIFATSHVDKVTPDGQRLLHAIAGLHLLAAVAAWAVGGPFVRGGGWKVAWIGSALLAPLVLGNLVPYGEYGASPACVQLCGYPVPPIIFLAFYPWISGVREAMRLVFEFALIGLIIAVPVLVVVRTTDHLSRDNIVGLMVTSSAYFIAYLLGTALARIFREAAAAQVEAGLAAQREAFNRSYNTLHDEIELALDAALIHHRNNNPERMREGLRRIQEVILRERTRILLGGDAVSVAKLIELQIALVDGMIEDVRVAGAGATGSPTTRTTPSRKVPRNPPWRAGPGPARDRIHVSCSRSSRIIQEVCRG